MKTPPMPLDDRSADDTRLPEDQLSAYLADEIDALRAMLGDRSGITDEFAEEGDSLSERPTSVSPEDEGDDA